MNKADSLLLQTRLSELLTGINQKIPQDELVATLSGAWAIPAEDVEFYLSAIGSYNIRAMMAGTKMQISYDRPHREVFRALDVLNGQSNNQSWLGRLWARLWQ